MQDEVFNMYLSESKSKQNIAPEGEELQVKNQEFSAIKNFQLQREDLSVLVFQRNITNVTKLSRGNVSQVQDSASSGQSQRKRETCCELV